MFLRLTFRARKNTRRILRLIGHPPAISKTSILFFQKFAAHEKRAFDCEYRRAEPEGIPPSECIVKAIVGTRPNYEVFLAEANWMGLHAYRVTVEQ